MKEKAENLANLLRQKILGGKVISIKLSDKHNAHFAKILLQNYQNRRVAVIADLQNETAENLLTSAILYFGELEKTKTKSAEKIWIISNQAEKLAKICSTLNETWQQKITIFDNELNEVFYKFVEVKKAKLTKPKSNQNIEKIIEISTEKIQISGNNLTFLGLPFAKFDAETIWFGVEHFTQILDEISQAEFTQLIEKLTLYRNYDSPNKKHIFYKLLSEAWLESVLRNNISLLDENLILSPIHAQFRASNEQIDLLALTKNGRLVIIELKVSLNREHLFQSVDYWQEIEKQRLAGNLQSLFGELEIANLPTLVYLVAPRTAYHKDFDYLAKTVSDEIEIVRFDINENWRERLQVIEKRQVLSTDEY
jgi:hypothetical protein